MVCREHNGSGDSAVFPSREILGKITAIFLIPLLVKTNTSKKLRSYLIGIKKLTLMRPRWG